MRPSSQALLDEVLEFPADERGRLAALLIDSLDADTDTSAADEWSDEIARRLQAIDAGQVRMVPWSEAREIIRGEHERAAD